jgi:ankyrin repeat protein
VKVLVRVVLAGFCSLSLVCSSRGGASEEPLFEAVNKADLATLKALVQDGADLGVLDAAGGTLLLRAVYIGDADIVRYLLEKGVSVVKKGMEGQTALMCASADGCLEIVRLLLEKAAEVDGHIDTVDDEGYSSLMHAASRGQHDVAVLLIGAGANLDTASSERLETALFLAAERGHDEVVARLVEAGADLNSMNRLGWTAWSRARAKGFKSVTTCLEEAGANTNGVLDTVSLETARLALVELKTIDGAMGMWRIAHSKKASDVPKWNEIEEYLEDGSPLKQRKGLDVLGNPITLRSEREGPRVADATKKKFEAIVGDAKGEPDFWGKYGE